jgi:hypothetical protein
MLSVKNSEETTMNYNPPELVKLENPLTAIQSTGKNGRHDDSEPPNEPPSTTAYEADE